MNMNNKDLRSLAKYWPGQTAWRIFKTVTHEGRKCTQCNNTVDFPTATYIPIESYIASIAISWNDKNQRHTMYHIRDGNGIQGILGESLFSTKEECEQAIAQKENKEQKKVFGVN